MKKAKILLFNIQKRKTKINHKYFLLYCELIIFLLKIAFADLINIKKIRNLKNYYSEIHLVIFVKDSQEINFLNDGFNPEPDKVFINGVSSSCKIKCNLSYGNNNVTLRYDNQIESFYEMFDSLNNIIEVDLSNFDTSKVTSMYGMFENCENLEKINFGNINTSLVVNMEY